MREKQTLWMLMPVVLLICGTMVAQDDVTTLPIKDEQQLYEFVAEYNNNGPSNLQFGYLADVAGLSSVFSSTTTKNESTALFTIVISANAFQVVSHGGAKVYDRVGTCTIYLNNGPSDFANPASFSQGTPIQVSIYRQTVLANAASNTFISTNTHTITDVETFNLNGVNYRLGQVGKSYRSTYNGEAAFIQPPIVTGQYAAAAVGMK